jgi:hypothetical protein
MKTFPRYEDSRRWHDWAEDYYEEIRDQWAADRARAEAEWERWASGWVEAPEEEEEEE